MNFEATALVSALALPITAFTTGLLGSVHCAGMCGAVSSVITVNGTAPNASPFPIRIVVTNGAPPKTITTLLAFNVGRIGSYMIAGAIAGAMGAAFSSKWLIGESNNARLWLYLFANFMVIATGLYLMGIPQLLAPLERVGSFFWRRVSPLTKTLLPLNNPLRAATFGALWGWIPCGMVYATLLTSMSAGSAAAGSLVMFAFGLGTLPMMLATGLTTTRMLQFTRQLATRRAIGAIIIAIGLIGVYRADGLAQLKTFSEICFSSNQRTHAAEPLRYPPASSLFASTFAL